MEECKNCCYLAVTEDPFWKGKEHCCFHEWGHGDWEKAPCDEEWERNERESYADPYPEEEKSGIERRQIMNGIMHLMAEEKPEDRRKVIIIYNGISEWNSRYDGAMACIEDDDVCFDLDGEYSATPNDVYAWIYEEDLNKLLGI